MKERNVRRGRGFPFERSHLGRRARIRWIGPPILVLLCSTLVPLSGCDSDNPTDPGETVDLPEQAERFGIYRLDPSTGATELVYSSANSLHRLHENPQGTKLVFREGFGDDVFQHSEICVVNPDGTGYQRLTDNGWPDFYPSWSPDGTKILFLSWPDYPDNTLDIFVMDADGGNPVELYDSGSHDADCHWVGSRIVFTRDSQIWIMDDDGTDARQVTDFEQAGQQGSADLPFGDYDPRLCPTGDLICFDRMVDDENPSGNWNFYTVNADGTGETAITDTGWQQFIAEWSEAGDRLLFTVAAMDGEGLFDMYTMSPDGSDLSNITPANWPATFLCTHGIFSEGDSRIYFVGEWWQQTRIQALGRRPPQRIPGVVPPDPPLPWRTPPPM